MIIRLLASKLGNALTKEERNIIRQELYKIENQKRQRKTLKERAYAYLINLTPTLDNNKKKYQRNDYHNPDYFLIRDIKNMHSNIDDYYKAILANEYFKC